MQFMYGCSKQLRTFEMSVLQEVKMNTIWICDCGAAIPSMYKYCLNCGKHFQELNPIQNDLKNTWGMMKYED